MLDRQVDDYDIDRYEDDRPDGTQRAIWSGEELEVVFTAGTEPCDYGVPRSPQWTEPTDISVESVSLLGVDVEMKSLPKELQKNILELSEEVEWSSE